MADQKLDPLFFTESRSDLGTIRISAEFKLKELAMATREDVVKYIQDRSKKVYVTGKFEDWERVRDLQTQLKALGYTIAFDWTIRAEHKKGPQSRTEMASHLEAIRNADYFILVDDDQYQLKNSLVWLGAFLAEQLHDFRAYVISPSETNRVMMYQYCVELENEDVLLEQLFELEEQNAEQFATRHVK